jgi:hypothetical protein
MKLRIFKFSNVIAVIICIIFIFNQVNGQDNFYPISVRGKIGYINSIGKIVIKPIFDNANFFSEGLAAVEVGRKYYSFQSIGESTGYYFDVDPKDIDSLESQAVKAVYPVQGKWGFIDTLGQWIIMPYYDLAGSFKDGLAPVNIGGYDDEEGGFGGGKWGYVDKRDSQLIPPRFDGATDFSEGLAAVDSGGKTGFIDKRGEWVITPQFQYAEPFKYGVALFRDEKKQEDRYIDKNDQTYEFPPFFAEQCSIKNVDGLYGIFDSTGKVIIPPSFQLLGPFIEGRARAEVRYKWGIIDHAGKFIFQPQYDMVEDFSGGRAAVRMGVLWGYIDTSGNLVIPIIFGRADSFDGPLARVELLKKIVLSDGKEGTTPVEAYINQDGKVIWKEEKRY